MPSSPGQACALARRAARSNIPVGREGDDGGWRPAVADAQGERAGVDAGKAGQALASSSHACSVWVDRQLDGSVTSCLTTRPSAAGIGRLHVARVGADIADMREGEGDDLPGVGRVGQRLLVACHPGVEAKLPHAAVARRAEAAPPEHGAVRQHEDGSGTGRGGVGLGHGGARLRRLQVGEGQPRGGHDDGPVLGGNRTGLPPFADRLVANSGEPGGSVLRRQAARGCLRRWAWTQAYGKKLPEAKDC